MASCDNGVSWHCSPYGRPPYVHTRPQIDILIEETLEQYGDVYGEDGGRRRGRGGDGDADGAGPGGREVGGRRGPGTGKGAARGPGDGNLDRFACHRRTRGHAPNCLGNFVLEHQRVHEHEQDGLR